MFTLPNSENNILILFTVPGFSGLINNKYKTFLPFNVHLIYCCCFSAPFYNTKQHGNIK